MGETFLAIAAIALVDSINPATIAQAAVFAGTERPARAVLGFWAGAMATYLVTGLLVLAGLDRFVRGVADNPPDWLFIALIAGGLAAVVAGVVAWRGSSKRRIGALVSSGDHRTAATVGVVATLTDLPTALPYFAAIGIITGTQLNRPEQFGLMIAYNLIYMMPVLIVLAIRLAGGPTLRGRLERFTELIARYSDRIVALLLIGGGLAVAIWAGFELT